MAPSDLRPPVVWVRSPPEIENPDFGRALLLPAWEVLVRAGARPAEAEDPFERAVLGAHRAGTKDPEEQATALGLDVDFVRHVHRRLHAAGRFHTGPRPTGGERATHAASEALSFFVTPGGAWWPRFVRHSAVRRPVTGHEGRPVIRAGTDGDPIDVTARYLEEDHGEAPEFDVDRAHEALTAWNRDLVRQGQREATVRATSLRSGFPATAVHLAAPIDRRGSRPVLDPFGGTTWRPMLESVTSACARDRGLLAWLGSVDASPSDNALADPVGRAAQLLEQRGDDRQTTRATQLRLDLLGCAHDLFDHLLTNAPKSPTLRRMDGFVPAAATSFGFRADVLLHVPDPGGQRLRDRLASLLTCYSTQDRGPVHSLAARCPRLLEVLCHGAEDRRLRHDDLKMVVRTLVEHVRETSRGDT